jgi:hypothetical protein
MTERDMTDGVMIARVTTVPGMTERAMTVGARIAEA